MNSELEQKLQSCPSLPSPAPVAVQIISLANEPEIDLHRLIAIVHCDPALASKILRIANSPLYPYSKKIENLHQALMVLGLNATISLALSFSLMQSLQSSRGSGLNYGLYWKRALVAGIAGRVLGTTCGITEVEELYLSSLLQDLGMLALDQVFPDLYSLPELEQTNHDSILSHEQRYVGINHAAVGSWLLTQWNFPDRLKLAVAASDEPSRVPRHDVRAKFIYCVSLSGKIAEIFLRESQGDVLQMVKVEAHKWLNLAPENLLEILEITHKLFPETEKIFQTELQTGMDPHMLLEKARESLLFRNLQALQEVQELQVNAATMEAQFHNMEDRHRLDPLTGTLSRASLDQSLEGAFEQALAKQESCTLIFGDLDKFKSVNDRFGHQAGDLVLQSTGRLLLSKIRATDVAGRYGGEEFVLILPNTPSTLATLVCERILAAFQQTSHPIGKNKDLTVTMSLGSATHTPDDPFPDILALLHAADKAMYYSKSHGGNRYTAYDKIGKKDPISC